MDRRLVGVIRASFARLLLFCVLGSTAPGVRAADVGFDGTNGAAGFEAALRAAGPGGSVTLTRGFTLDRTVFVQVPDVTVSGRRQTVREGAPKFMFIVAAPDVTFAGVVFQMQREGFFRQCITPRAENLTVRNCTFSGGSGGIRNTGEPPRGLRVFANTFTSVTTGVAFNRDVVRVPGNPALPEAERFGNRVARALDGGRFDIFSNRFVGDFEVGITLDAGNDGRFGNPIFPDRANPLRDAVTGRTTDFFDPRGGRSSISGNVIDGARGFGIALARVNGISITGNRITLPSTGNAFRFGINLENRTNGVNISNNDFRINDRAGGFAAGIGLVTFTDYGNAADFANGARRIVIENNRFGGSNGRGIAGNGFADVRATDNDFTQFADPRLYSFFNAPGGVNEITGSGNRPRDP